MASGITRDNSIPRKSEKYRFGEAVVQRQFNDIDFYFEDEKQEEMYHIIVKKLFGDEIKFDRVFITNGKDGAYRMLKLFKNNKRKIFVVDKDFDDLLRRKKRGINNLFYLNRYSIENFLVEEDALKKFVISRKPTLNRTTLGLPYNSLIEVSMRELQLLACYFFIANKYKITSHIQGLKTCKLPLERFLLSDKSGIDPAKVASYWQPIEQAIITHIPAKTPSEIVDSAKKSIDYDKIELDGVCKHIPGKHFLDLLKNKLNRLYPFIAKSQLSEMKFAMADKCSFTSLNGFKQDISSYLELS